MFKTVLSPAATLIFCVLILPLLLSALWVKVATSAAIFALAAADISVLFAQLGLINLAQIALVGVGGWIALRLNYATSLPVTSIVLIAGIGASAIGAVLALPAMRMRGLYLALVTLMAAGAFQILFNAFQFPNGGAGFWGGRPPICCRNSDPCFSPERRRLFALHHRHRSPLFWVGRSAQDHCAGAGVGHDPAIRSKRDGRRYQCHILQDLGIRAVGVTCRYCRRTA